ncbi:unnamed protein product [Polarella glacialis]|uniref:Metalloendopeptidase n=1 Tax=Polarella glacialis TaxID=89957 RepID=A0A813HSN8_POLGL|nr:unnamed protein product [Polarella glacialis]
MAKSCLFVVLLLVAGCYAAQGTLSTEEDSCSTLLQVKKETPTPALIAVASLEAATQADRITLQQILAKFMGVPPFALQQLHLQNQTKVTLAEKVEGLAELVEDLSSDQRVLAEARKVAKDAKDDEKKGGDATLQADDRLVVDLANSVEGELTPEAAAKAGVELTADDFAQLANSTDGHGHLVSLETFANGSFQGDMMPASPEQLQSFIELSAKWSFGDQNGGMSFGAGEPWAGGVVKYCFASDVKEPAKKAALAAMEQYKKAVPCIQWKDVGYKSKQLCNESPAAFIQSLDSGCWSYVGMLKWQPSQLVNLQSPGCDQVGTVIHELGHTLGMGHEQSRPDRDAYVDVHMDKVKPGMEINFDITPKGDVSRPYDILSVMHYGLKFFGMNDAETITIKPQGYILYTNDSSQYSKFTIGDRIGLSQFDADQVVDLYKSEVSTCYDRKLTTEVACVDRTPNGAPWTDQYSQGCAAYKSFEIKGTITDCALYASGHYCCACKGGWRLQTWAEADPNQVPNPAIVVITATTTTTTTTTTSLATDSPNCADSVTYRDAYFGAACVQWAGYQCKGYPFSPELEAGCPVTCGMCAAGSGNCKDTGGKLWNLACANLKNYGLCTPSWGPIWSWVQKNCMFSCDVCSQ